MPEAGDRQAVHRVIYEELVQGRIEPASRDLYREVIERLVARGAEAIILGCTEIMLLIGAKDSAVPLFDTTKIHADAAVGPRPGTAASFSRGDVISAYCFGPIRHGRDPRFAGEHRSQGCGRRRMAERFD